MDERIIEAFERFDLSAAEVRHPDSGRLISFDKDRVFRMARVFCQAMHAAGGSPPGPLAVSNAFISRRPPSIGWSDAMLDAMEMAEEK